MSTNRYPAICTRCKENVPVQEGNLEKKHGAWEVRHIKECPDVVALSVGRIITYESLSRPGEIFMDEDFGIVVTMASVPWYPYEDDVDDDMNAVEIFARAANTEEREVFAAKEKAAVIRGEKRRAVVRLMEEGRINCTCWDDAAACKAKAPHLDETRESYRITLRNGNSSSPSIYADIPADISLPIFIHSWDHSRACSGDFKEIEYSEDAVELLHWQAEEVKKRDRER